MIKKLEHEWMWLDQWHKAVTRNLVRKKSENDKRTVASRR